MGKKVRKWLWTKLIILISRSKPRSHTNQTRKMMRFWLLLNKEARKQCFTNLDKVDEHYDFETMYKLYEVGRKISASDECKVFNSFEE